MHHISEHDRIRIVSEVATPMGSGRIGRLLLQVCE
jgi:hypothetical protein